MLDCDRLAGQILSCQKMLGQITSAIKLTLEGSSELAKARFQLLDLRDHCDRNILWKLAASRCENYINRRLGRGVQIVEVHRGMHREPETVSAPSDKDAVIGSKDNLFDIHEREVWVKIWIAERDDHVLRPSWYSRRVGWTLGP